MLFVNMCEDIKNECLLKRDGNFVPSLKVTPQMVSENPAGGMTLSSGSLVWDERVTPNANIFGTCLTGGEGMLTKQLSFEDIKDTSENPVLVILFNELTVFENIVAHIKLVRVDDTHMLGALVAGACMFNGVALQRCNTSNLDTAKVGKVLTPKDIFGWSVLVNRYLPTPKGSGVVTTTQFSFNYSYTTVLHVKIMCKADGEFTLSNIRDNEFVFDRSNYDKAKFVAQCQLDAYVAKKEEDRKAREKQRSEYEQQAREKAEKEQREQREKKEMEESMKSQGVKTTKGMQVSSTNAEGFLAAVMAASGRQ